MDFSHFKALLSRTLNGFFPGRCLHCQLPSHRAVDLCVGCEAELVKLAVHCSVCAEPLPHPGICGHCLKSPPDFFQIVAPYSYEPPLDGWIIRFKHHGDLRAGRVLGWLLAQYINGQFDTLLKPDCLLPVPLHWRRRLSRGFNQADEITKLIARETGLPLNRRLVSRNKHTGHQQTLNREQRRRNLRRAFLASPRCDGLHIGVIDDVVTTASTARAIASALTDAGARSVQIWAVARTALEK